MVDAYIEWYRTIQRIGARPIPEVVGVPVCVATTSAIERSGLFSQPDKAFTFLYFFIRRNLFTNPAGTESFFVLVNRFSLQILKMKSQFFFLDDQDHHAGADPQVIGCIFNVPIHPLRNCDGGIGKIFKGILAANLDPDYGFRVNRNPEFSQFGGPRNAGAHFFPMDDLTRALT